MVVLLMMILLLNSAVCCKDDESVGVVLDGIAGMFNDGDHTQATERGHVLSRKGIVKVALKAGVPIIPVYAFGATSLWSIFVDPFGMLEQLSIRLNVSIVPFFGRWGWPFGAPRRAPLLLAFGEPIAHPQTDFAKFDNEQGKQLIDRYHAKLVQGFCQVFDTHKVAYGWGDKSLELV